MSSPDTSNTTNTDGTTPSASPRPPVAIAVARRLGVALAVVLLMPVSLFTAALARGRGPAAAPPKVGDMAPDFTVAALDGSKVTLSKLTAQGPVALIILRGYPGYQCPFCTRQVGDLIGKASQFSAAGAHVVLVYPGPAEGLQKEAEEFVGGKDIPKNFTFALDPDYTLTNQYNLRWNAPHETAFPSTFVLDNKGKVVFAKISHGHGDRAKSADILAALSSLSAPAPATVAAPAASTTVAP